MKKVFLFTAFIGLFLSINAQHCDTLKWKTKRTVYGDVSGGYFVPIGNLDGAEIDLDKFPTLAPGIEVVNISNDVYSNEIYLIIMYYLAYADTGLIAEVFTSGEVGIDKEIIPNETVNMGFDPVINLLGMINTIKDSMGIDFEQISHWKLIIGMGAAIKDGYYTQRVFYEGADTSVFYVKRGVGIEAMKQNVSSLSLFPNPATTQLTLDNKDALIKEAHIYDVTGREVSRHSINANQSTLDISTLKSGLYIVKIHTEQGVLNRKIQVVK